jgi:hypothetical protein
MFPESVPLLHRLQTPPMRKRHLAAAHGRVARERRFTLTPLALYPDATVVLPYVRGCRFYGADHDEAVKLGLPEQVTQDDWPELVTAGVDAGIEIVLDDKI